MGNIRVGIYPRVSTQEQAKEGYSIGEQTARLNKYCEAMGWTVVNCYTDPGYSGAKLDRPGLKEMIKDVKAGKLDKVVVYKLDRLSRSQKDTLYLIEDVFLKNNTDFVSMSENFDTATPFGRAMIGILAVFAQLEREQIKERLTMGREARAKSGHYTGNDKVLIGYDYRNGELVVNEFEKIIVNEVFKLFNEGTSIKTIAGILNKRGLNHKFGDWNDMTVRRLLKNRHYIGEVKFSEKWYPGNHEPIIDLGIFNTAQKLLKVRQDNYTGSNKNMTALGGLIWCARCGGRYHRQTYKPKADGTKTARYVCYSRSKKQKKLVVDPNCKNRIYEIDELDNIIFDEIRKLAIDPDYMNELKSEDNIDSDEKIRVLKNEIHDLTEQISGYMDLYAIKRLSLTEVDNKIEPLAERRDKLEEELEELTEDIEDNISEEDTISIVKSFGDILERRELDEIRLTVSTLIRRIEIDGEDVKIYWNF